MVSRTQKNQNVETESDQMTIGLGSLRWSLAFFVRRAAVNGSDLKGLSAQTSIGFALLREFTNFKNDENSKEKEAGRKTKNERNTR